MTTKASKLLFLLALYCAGHLLEACTDPLCRCEPVLPFFDYHALSLTANTIQGVQPTLQLQIRPEQIEFLSQVDAPTQNGFSLLTTAWACDCPVDGDSGDKFLLTDVDITADQPYNDTLPAGTSLKGIFTFYSGGDVVYPLNYPLGQTGFGTPEGRFSFSTLEPPENLALDYSFTVSLKKSNGETLSIQTPPLSFQ